MSGPTGRRTDRRWERRYAGAAAVSDVGAALLAVAAGLLGDPAGLRADLCAAALLSAAVVGGLVVAAVATRAWDRRMLGQGPDEFGRLFRAVGATAAIVGVAGLLLDSPATTAWLFGVVPFLGLLAATGRYVLRRRLHALRRRGGGLLRVLAVGSDEAVADLISRTQRAPQHGWRVTGACTSTGTGPAASPELLGVPVVGDLDAVGPTARTGGYEVVAVAPVSGWGHHRLRRLAWELGGTGIDLVVQPGLIDVTGPRLHVAPVDGLPLLKLSEPVLGRGAALVKAVMDRTVAATLILLLAPVLLAVTLSIKATGGPVLAHDVRVGRGGRLIRVLRFRTTTGAGHGPEAVTAIGALLKASAVEELPQLFNVLAGSMSLVGPRPPRPVELAASGRDAHRTLLVKPGLTGLWQVAGRGGLTWEESVRLDLRYVESWSPALDALILWRGVRGVVRGGRALHR
ncbi:sugar transferase [Pseudonocardia kujensis]|uniref:sugar transferase n=1 Tax=Pseudonocardia kujensis TaxID=1128675 RepID=UPI001E2D8C64|nr:sugar transferase [Pseudonocardia kujensis]MCE0763131.1 sugar transferase [Pseudonocardia kujensis]